MKNENNKKRRGPMVLLLIVLAVSALVYIEISGGMISGALGKSRKTLLPEGIVFEYISDGRPVFSRGQSGFLHATKDGATYYSYKGPLLWNDTYSMQAPIVVANGDNWAVLEPEGRKVYVYGADGFRYEIFTDYPILSAYINKIACLVLILDTGTSCEIRFYNAVGEESFRRLANMEGVFPTCAALSDDGMTFCVAYLNTTKAALSSSLQFFYTDSGAKRYGTDEQTPFKAIEKQNAIITKLAFNKDSMLMGLTDTELFVTTPKGEEVFSYKLQNQLESFYFDDSMIAVTVGPPLTNAIEPFENGSAVVFGYDGRRLAEFGGSVESAEVYDELILLKSGNAYRLNDAKGNEFWTYGASDDILALLPVDKNRVLIAKAGIAEVYGLKLPKGGGKNDG